MLSHVPSVVTPTAIPTGAAQPQELLLLLELAAHALFSVPPDSVHVTYVSNHRLNHYLYFFTTIPPGAPLPQGLLLLLELAAHPPGATGLFLPTHGQGPEVSQGSK